MRSCAAIQSQNMTSRYRPQCTSCSVMVRSLSMVGVGNAAAGTTVSYGSARSPPAQHAQKIELLGFKVLCIDFYTTQYCHIAR